MALNPIVKGTLDEMLGGNSLVAETPGAGRPIHEWGYGHDQEHRAKQESGWYAASREHPEVGLMNPQEFEEWKKANGLPPTPPPQIGLGGPKTEVAMEDWRKPYVIKWQKHHNPNDPFFIKDKEYLKNLQDIVIFHRPV
jgi:hypothetical protein